MKKHYLKLLVLLLVSMSTYGQNIQFTDLNFKKALVDNNVDPYIDRNRDGEISISEAEEIKLLFLPNRNIRSLEEIHFFRGLIILDCQGNKLTSLDVSKNLELSSLYCDNNELTSLNVSKNSELSSLDCQGNKLTSLDVSKHTKLRDLDCSNNELFSLDISKNLLLNKLDCGYNQLSSLDVSKHTKLKELDCSNNDLFSLDVSKNLLLNKLGCDYNRLSSIDVSKNLLLNELGCGYNQLLSIDVSKNINLRKLDCSHNKLSSIDVSKNLELTELLCFSNNLINLKVRNAKLEKIYFENNRVLTTAHLTSPLLKKNEIKFKNCPKLNLICVDKSQIDNFKNLCDEYKYTNCNVSSSCTLNVGREKINKALTKVKFNDYFKLYPNPTTHILNIEPIEDDIKVKFIYIYNNYGSLVAFFQGTVKQLNLDFLVPEYYHVRLETDKGMLSAPFVIR